MASLHVKYGAMNCGKTTIAIQTSFNYKEQGMDVYIIKPKQDSKGDDTIVSRINISEKADLLSRNEDNLFDIVSNIKDKKIACVIVDESQFLTIDQVYQLLDITIDLNIPVICFGIRTDAFMKAFKSMAILLCLAHEISEIKTICKCSKKATFNLRRENGIPVFEGNVVAIDGENNITYEAVCGKCYKKFKKESENKKN